MGLLRKANPGASGRSVIAHALRVSVLGTCLFLLVLWSNNGWTGWPLKVGTCAVLLALVGGLWEWQVPSEDLAEDGDPQPRADDSKQGQG